MSYQIALKAAGAKILAFKEFGSYQGDWYAKVVYKGATGWIKGSYGSCSGCDSFQGEFDYISHEHDDKYFSPLYSPEGCLTECDECNSFKQKLSDFGMRYLDGLLMTQEETEKEAGRNIEWDSDAPEMLQWIKDNKI